MWGCERLTDYAGDIEPTEAWRLMRDEGALLVDVRTPPEWSFVGTPDVSGEAAEPALLPPIFLPWADYPSMQLNPAFADQLEVEMNRRGLGADTAIVFLCRSGVRSLGAARAMAARGYSRAYNIEGGFEGDKDGEGHRGRTGGWKVAGLPWKQG